MNSPFVFPGGQLTHDTQVETLVNNTALTRTRTVPSNKRWVLVNGYMANTDNVTRDCEMYCTTSAGVMVAWLNRKATVAATTGMMQWPCSEASVYNAPRFMILDEGEKVVFRWAANGASAGAAATSSLTVLEMGVTY